MKKFLLDANVILRFLTQDHPAKARAATALFGQAKNKEALLVLDSVILAEVIYALEGHYKRSRHEIAGALLQLVTSQGIEAEPHFVIVNALLRYKAEPVDFPDAWLAASAFQRKLPAASFDKDIDRFRDVTRYEPEG
jgi:predicted nucleic acid-binding protein